MAETRRYGGTRLAGRRYHHGQRPVEVVTGWGPGATVRNVRIRYLDDGTEAVRPFRGLTIAPRRTKSGGPNRVGSAAP